MNAEEIIEQLKVQRQIRKRKHVSREHRFIMYNTADHDWQMQEELDYLPELAKHISGDLDSDDPTIGYVYRHNHTSQSFINEAFIPQNFDNQVYSEFYRDSKRTNRQLNVKIKFTAQEVKQMILDDIGLLFKDDELRLDPAWFNYKIWGIDPVRSFNSFISQYCEKYLVLEYETSEVHDSRTGNTWRMSETEWSKLFVY